MHLLISFSGQVNETIDVFVVAFHVPVFDEPLYLFLDHFFGRFEQVFENFNEFSLQLGIADSLAHLQYLDYGFLCAQYAQLNDPFVFFFFTLLGRQLQPPD